MEAQYFSDLIDEFRTESLKLSTLNAVNKSANNSQVYLLSVEDRALLQSQKDALSSYVCVLLDRIAKEVVRIS